MDSEYAVVHFTGTIGESDVNVRGEIVQMNEPSFAGQTELMSVRAFKDLQNDFPDRVEGRVIKKEELLDTLNDIYGKLKADIEALGAEEHFAETTLTSLRTFEHNGVLRPDGNDDWSMRDLANKVFLLQKDVRRYQRQQEKARTM